MAANSVASGDVEAVWNAWRSRQRRPDLVRLTAERRKLIGARLRLGYTAEEFVVLIRYAWESQDPGPKWWRGANEARKTYLDLENLLRVAKLGERIPRALEWAEEGDRPTPSTPMDGGAGPLARFRSARR